MRRSLSQFPILTILVTSFLGCHSNSESVPRLLSQRPTRVEVFRVSPEVDGSTKAPTINGYPILATSQEQGLDFGIRLSKVLQSQGVVPNRKKCGMQPGVAYRIWYGPNALEVLVCFRCDVLWPYVVGKEMKGTRLDWKDFDAVRPELLALTKEAFPDDREIQKLPVNRK